MGCRYLEVHRWLECSRAMTTASPEEPSRAPLLQPDLNCSLNTASLEVQSGRQSNCRAIVKRQALHSAVGISDCRRS